MQISPQTSSSDHSKHYTQKELQIFSGWDEPPSNSLWMEIYCSQSVNKSDKLMQLGKFSTDSILKRWGMDSFIFTSKFQVYSLL